MNAEAAMDGGSAGGAMDIQAIMRILPHRYPLLYVDRVTECLPGKHIQPKREYFLQNGMSPEEISVLNTGRKRRKEK